MQIVMLPFPPEQVEWMDTNLGKHIQTYNYKYFCNPARHWERRNLHNPEILDNCGRIYKISLTISISSTELLSILVISNWFVYTWNCHICTVFGPFLPQTTTEIETKQCFLCLNSKFLFTASN